MDFFELNLTDYEYLVKECMLDEEFAKLLELKIRGCSNVQISLEMGYGERTVTRKVKKLEKKVIRAL